MIRRCPIIDCDNTEDQTPGHRFPQSKEQAQSWKDSLKLKEFPIELLQTKFFVCKNHFSNSDYSNDGQLLETAVPKLNGREEIETQVNIMDGMILQVNTVNSTGSACATDSESIEVVAPTIEMIARVHRLTLPNNCERTCNATEDSAYSQDIFILESHDSHCDFERFAGSLESCAMMQSVDAQDFTVLNADGERKYSMLQRCLTCTSCKNSSTMLFAQQHGKQNNATSGTDSDVEILMSEEIVYSDWSVENNDFLTISPSCSLDGRENTKPDSALAAVMLSDCSEQNVTTEENFSLDSFDAFEMMTHTQLVDKIKSQAAKIRTLEATLKRYRDAQSSLFSHVDALREEFEDDNLVNGTYGGGNGVP